MTPAVHTSTQADHTSSEPLHVCVDTPTIIVHDRSKMSPLEQMRTQPSKYFSIAQQCAILATQLRMPSGAPLVKIVEAAEEKLGLDAHDMRLFERCARCYD